MNYWCDKRCVFRLDWIGNRQRVFVGEREREREGEFVSHGWAKNGERTRTQSGKFGSGDLEAESV